MVFFSSNAPFSSKNKVDDNVESVEYAGTEEDLEKELHDMLDE